MFALREKDTTLVLVGFKKSEFVQHHRRIASTLFCNSSQAEGVRIPRYIFTLSAKCSISELLTQVARSFIKVVKSKGPRFDPCGTLEFIT